MKTLTSPIEAANGKIPVLVSSLKMYSLIIVDNPKNAFIPNIHVPLQITNMVT